MVTRVRGTRIVGWTALAGACAAAMVVAATAPASGVGFRADETARRAMFDAVARAEAATRVQTAQNFPGDLWSADDDFHNAELRMAHGLAAAHGAGVADVLRAIDEGLRAHWPVPGPPPLPTSPPCHPRPEYYAKPLRVLGRALAETPVRLAVFALLALVTAWPLLATGNQLNLFRDAHIHFVYERAAVSAVRRFGQAPLWDPYYCGGIYALGSPQIRFASPTFLFDLFFGAARGEGLTAFFMLVVGLEGTFRYARGHGGGALGSTLAAPLFALSGFFAAAPFLGWANFYSFELLPWAAWGMRRAVAGRPSGVAVTAVAGASIIGLGGTYSAPMAGLLCAFEVALGAWTHRRSPAALGRVAAMAALTGLLTLGLAAVRLWPVMETLARAPRVLGGKPGTPLADVVAALIEPVRVRDGNIVSRRMYFVGALAAPALLAGLWRRRSWPLVALGALALWAATGYAMGWSPFVGLKRLPVFSALRYPERYLILVALAVAVVSAIGVRTLEALARRRLPWVAGVSLLAVACALGANTVSLVSDHHLVAQRRLLAPAAPVLDREFHQARGNRWAVSYYPAMSRGSLSCMDAYPVPESPRLRGDLDAEEYLLDPGAGTVTRASWSPRRINLHVELTRPARLAVNQNYHPGWRASVGTVADDDGLLTVDLPPGRHELSLRFLPRSAVGGAATSLAALAVLVWMALRARRRDELGGGRPLRLYALAAVAPLAVAALARVAIPEPPMPRTEPRAPNGEPILVDGPAAGANQIGAALGEGVTLVAARATRTASVPRGALLELDLRVDGRPAEETGVAVQAESDAGEVLRFDHVLLSAWTDLVHAPRGRLVRDFVPLAFPPGIRGTHWRVRVGLKKAGGPTGNLIEAATFQSD